MTRCIRWMMAAAMMAAGAGPALAQETPTEREAAKGVLQKMDALERSIDVPALVASLRAPNTKRRRLPLLRTAA